MLYAPAQPLPNTIRSAVRPAGAARGTPAALTSKTQASPPKQARSSFDRVIATSS
jgi:hypothetical protein